MKKILYLAISLLPLFSCGTGKKHAQVQEQLLRQNDSLSMVVAAKEAMIAEVFASITQIADNLTLIKTRENIISTTLNSGEIGKEPTAQISEDMQEIDRLLQRNRQSIVQLRKSAEELKKANAKIASLEQLIESLNIQIEVSSSEIRKLKSELSRKDVEIVGLSAEVTGLSREKSELEGEVKLKGDLLSMAYYVVGSQKELLGRDIIYKSGFIGRTLKINENRSLDTFTQVDTRTFEEVIIGKKNVQIVSSHPSGSYELVMDGKGHCTSLLIIDKQAFWEYAKVLVVCYK